jgi:uncharacterized RDD family membrane protein YckC
VSSPGSSTPHYVGFWPRLAASLIDLCALLLVVVPLTVWNFGAGWTELEGVLAFAVNWIAPGVLLLGCWLASGTTPGKILVSLSIDHAATIVDASTLAPPSPAQWIRRCVGYYLSAIPLFLGFVWIAFDARKQGWHDKIANTVVIRK